MQVSGHGSNQTLATHTKSWVLAIGSQSSQQLGQAQPQLVPIYSFFNPSLIQVKHNPIKTTIVSNKPINEIKNTQ